MEHWKSIRGHEGRYQVSNKGRVKSLQRVIVRAKTGELPVKEKMLKPISQSTGYLTVNLYGEKGMEQHSIHRLVARHFLEKPPGKDTVNHIDGIKINNTSENLEWCTVRENNIHAFTIGLSSPPKTSGPGAVHACFKGHVLAIHIKTGEVVRMAGSAEMKKLGFHDGCVSECISGKRKSHRGYMFIREDTE